MPICDPSVSFVGIVVVIFVGFATAFVFFCKRRGVALDTPRSLQKAAHPTKPEQEKTKPTAKKTAKKHKATKTAKMQPKIQPKMQPKMQPTMQPKMQPKLNTPSSTIKQSVQAPQTTSTCTDAEPMKSCESAQFLLKCKNKRITAVKDMFDQQLNGFSVHAVHNHLSNEAEKAAIDDSVSLSPLSTFRNPLIASNADQNAQKVLKTARAENPNSHDKGQAVAFIIRGRGTGKSRECNEIFSLLTRQQDVVVLPITANHNTSWDKFKSLCAEHDFRIHFAAQIVIRLAFAVHGFSEEASSTICSAVERCVAQAIREEMKEQVGTDNHTAARVELRPKQADNVAENLIRGFLAHAVEKICQHKKLGADKDKATVVMIVDESLKFHQQYLKHDDDIFSLLRKAILFETINHGNPIASNLHCGLVMSSLEIGPVYKTGSDRTLLVLPLAHKLPAKEVTERWYLPADKNIRDRTKKIKLFRFVAAVLETLPRGSQYAAQAIESAWSQSYDPTSLITVWDQVSTQLDEKYSKMSCPLLPPHIAHAVLFQKKIKVSDDEVPTLINQSILVNQVENPEAKVGFVPEVSMAMVLRANELCENAPLGDLPRLIAKLAAQKQLKAGDALELLLSHWLVLRLCVLREFMVATSPDANVPLAKVFGADGADVGSNILCTMSAVLYEKRLPKSFNSKQQTVGTTLLFNQRAVGKPDNKNKICVETIADDFWQFFASFVWETSAPVLFLADEKDHFDFVMLVKNTKMEWYVVFVDCKSDATDLQPASSQLRSSEIKLPTPPQAESVRFLAAVAKSFMVKPPFVDALANNRFVFVYFTTREHDIFQQTRVVCVGRKHAQKCLGPAWPLYQALHNACCEAQFMPKDKTNAQDQGATEDNNMAQR